MYKRIIITALLLVSLTGCQTIFAPTNPLPAIDKKHKLTPKRLDTFAITGKIGVIDKTLNQSGSAFYGWSQEQERFNIELQGALGIGFTRITYNGVTATLANGQVGTIQSDSPENLLLKATGWQAPISQLPYWISGAPAPSDSSQTLDQYKRLIAATNGDWQADFKYNPYQADSDNNKLPTKIISNFDDGKKQSKVVLTIEHNQQ